MAMQRMTIIGNVGGEPEMRYTQGGAPVTSFSVAVNERRGGQDGESKDTTTWFRVSCWNKLAEIASQYLTKGRQVFVEGPLRVNEFTGNDGKPRYSLEITARELQMLGGRPEGSQDAPGGQEAAAPPPAQRRDSPARPSKPLDDDSIPF